ncbi:MAG: OPT/YSL family transporter, partial [Candidatus Eisenbacteria bacterium]
MDSTPRLQRGFTLRAVMLGALIGVVQTLANVYMALKTGVWDGGFPTAAVLAFTLAGALRFEGFSPQENLVSQCVAAAACAVPATAGLLGAVPALQMLGRGPGAVAITLWAVALGTLGAVSALAFRQKLLIRETLVFPTGKVTADVITAMHTVGAGAASRARALGLSAGVAILFTWLRDGSRPWLPAMTALPLRIGGTSAAVLTLGVAWSPLMLGVGALVGPQIGLSMLLGAALAWGLLAPAALATGEVASADFGSLIGWLTWPGVALMVSGAMVALALQGRTLLRSLGSLGSPRTKLADPEISWKLRRVARLVALAAATIAVLVAWHTFALHPIVTLLAIGLSVILAEAAMRAAGETDFLPLGPMGQLGQAVFGPVSAGRPIADTAAGSVTGGIAETGVLVYMMRAGLDLRASVSQLFSATLVGIGVGAAVSVPAYWIVTRAYGLGTEALPASSARTWKAVAEVMTGNGAAIPPHALQAAWIAAVL